MLGGELLGDRVNHRLHLLILREVAFTDLGDACKGLTRLVGIQVLELLEVGLEPLNLCLLLTEHSL